ncbi:MAG: BCD family MFS transporter [Chloroflexi bacterium]|nr:BCD family MFS transporter [Chloroflexota bacterium]
MLIKRLQLGLIHVAVAMTLVPINSTLNRVMIKELALSAALVAALAALPYFFSPIQVAIGSFSDRHPILGLRRTPYIVLGLALCVLGMTLSPQAAFLLVNDFWAGLALGVAVFGAWGMGFNFATVAYLSLASEISGEKGRSKTVAVMWFMMITSIIVTAIALSQMVDPYTPAALVRSFGLIGVAALILGALGLLGLEKRSARREKAAAQEYSWGVLLRAVLDNRQATLFFWYLTILLAAILGQDILLEPFGAEAFGLSVKETTRITAIWGGCVLAALLAASFLEGRIGKRLVANLGSWGALAGFLVILLSGPAGRLDVFYTGVTLLGLGTGLATVSNLSLMLDMTLPQYVGLFIGAWGMSNALSRLAGTILGGVVRDVVSGQAQNALAGYLAVFAIEAGMILFSLFLLRRIDTRSFQTQAASMSLGERAAIAGDI